MDVNNVKTGRNTPLSLKLMAYIYRKVEEFDSLVLIFTLVDESSDGLVVGGLKFEVIQRFHL